jgi:hypothetical protein
MAATIAAAVISPSVASASVNSEVAITECVMDERTHPGNRLGVLAIAFADG